MKKLYFILFLCSFSFVLQAQTTPQTFDPPTQPLEFQALEIGEEIKIDGKIEEDVWQKAQAITGFLQQNPYQGEKASYDTEVRVLYDQKFLYVSAICKDSLKRKTSVRVQNMRRDCDFDQNDIFGFAIDGFLDKRNSVTFQTTPFGSQRDVQVIDSDIFNREWDGLWFVRTQIYRDSWTAEFAIPWNSLRYPDNTKQIGIIFLRNIRRNNEYTVLPSVPRAFTPYRMAYEAVITNLNPPKPSANFQINPYFLLDGYRRKEGELPQEEDLNPKIGGEVKWAVSPSTVLDLTVNTDFAQADVDRQVVNLSRYSILFPERRQFFLENANIFNASVTDFIQPFFSRRIGLDNFGNAIPLDAGFRLTNVTNRHSLGVLAMRQRQSGESPVTNFGVLRYSQNIGKQNRIGGMFTYRRDEALENNGNFINPNSNYTTTIDCLFRPSQTLTVQGMVSGVNDDILGEGLAAQGFIGFQNNLFYIGLLEYFVKNYHPGIGLERFGQDYLMTSPALDFDLRPKWLPKSIRSYGPDAYAYIFHHPETGKFILADVGFSLFDIDFQTGANLEMRHNPTWQVLEEEFEPVSGIAIPAGRYFYLPSTFSYNSDLSKKVGFETSYSTGKYYNGKLRTWTFSGRFAPIPHIEFSADYEYNRFKDFGEEKIKAETHLLGVNARLALNPRVQLIGFYQRNTSLNRDIWNVRLSWEYRPLSYIFVVFNSNRINSLNPQDRFSQQQGIAKITYMKQF